MLYSNLDLQYYGKLSALALIGFFAQVFTIMQKYIHILEILMHSQMFAGFFGLLRAENRPEDAEDSFKDAEDEENPRPINKWEADEKDSIQAAFQNQAEPTSPEPQELCFCQRRWTAKNLSLYLPEEDRKKYLDEGVPLYNAILNGDLVGVKRILKRDPSALLYSSITEGYETALHVAVGARQVDVVKDLAPQMESEELELQDGIGNTAFCIGAATDCVEIAKILVANNSKLPLLRGACNKTPLNIAAVYGYPDMIRFIYQEFQDHIPHLNEEELEEIFFACIHAGLFDLAIKMLEYRGNLAWARNEDGETALGILARMPSAFATKSTSRTPKALIDLFPRYGRSSNTISTQNKALELTKLITKTMLTDEGKPLKDTIDQTSEALFEATRLGNYNFLALVIGSYPHLILKKDENKGSIFHVAVSYRQESIFKQIHKIGLWKDMIVTYEVRAADESKESQASDKHIRYNILHLAAKLPSLDRINIVSGPALQMQRELQWFKEVEDLMHPSEREKRDSKYKLTPRELFTKEHSELRKAGEEWMKNTAESCMIVATLVTAVVFTVTSSLPGGNDSATGTPMNIHKTMFHVFAVADAVALYSSIISTLMFLSIFTSRYAEDDFLVSLPLRLAAGITALLMSTMGMMVAFAAIFFLAYGKHEVRWVPILASAMSFFPVVIVFVFQYQVVRDLCVSTFSSRLFRPSNKSKFWGAQF